MNELSQNIDVPETVKRAEILFYVFRDSIGTNGPDILGTSSGKAVGSSVDQTLAEISGISHKDVVLDGKPESRLCTMTETEWLEIVELLAVDTITSGQRSKGVAKIDETNGWEAI